MVWKLSLYILWATSFFTLISADLVTRQSNSPLNTCTLLVQSTVSNVADPQTVMSYGILNRFANSDPSVNPLTIEGGGTSDVYEDLGNGLYTIGFSVKSNEYEMWQLKSIVTEQWANTSLFERDVGKAGNWNILSIDC